MEVKSNITGGKTEKIFKAKIMGKYSIQYYRCLDTGYIQVEKPYWLDEAYSSPMNLTDTGILLRNQLFLEKIGSLLFMIYDPNHHYLDYAGGYGIFTRLMRDSGFDFYWQDPYTKNLVARGFEYDNKKEIQALTSFETFEHFVNPYDEISKMLGISRNIIFSTQLVPEPYPQSDQWWYYGLEHGQHVSLYTKKSLEYIAKEYSLKLYTNNSDLHALLDTNITPRILVGRWVNDFNKSTNGLFRDDFKQVNVETTSLEERLFYKFKLGKVLEWSGSPSRQSELKKVLDGNDFLERYMSHIITEGQIYWKIVKKLMKGKTFEDMLWIRDHYLKELTQG